MHLFGRPRSAQPPTKARLTVDRQAAGEQAEKEDRPDDDEAKLRLNPTISPDSDEFRRVVHMFGAALRDQSTSQVMHTHFTPHERALLLPVTRRDNAALHRLQRENRMRYSRMLRSDRWRAWAPHATLAFKFAQVYFGLAVAPMHLDFAQRSHGFGDLGDEGDEGDEGDDDEEEEPPGGHLRFLNGYSARSYGHDTGRSADPDLERYYAYTGFDLHGKKVDPSQVRGYPISLGLRGGGGGGGGSDDDDDDDTTSSLLCLRGGAGGPGQDGHRYVPTFLDPLYGGLEHKHGMVSRAFAAWNAYCTEHGIRRTIKSTDEPFFATNFAEMQDGEAMEAFTEAPKPLILPLYGSQGIVWFNLHSFESFVDAVDRLLGLGTRAAVQYKIEVFDKDRDYGQKAARDDHETTAAGLPATVTFTAGAEGAYSEYEHWEVVRSTVETIFGTLHSGQRKEEDDTPAQRSARFHKAALFVHAAGVRHNWQWEPVMGEEDDEDDKGELRWLMRAPTGRPDDRPDVAYVRVPARLGGDAGFANVVDPWLRSAMRVLTPGMIPGRPGQPQVPDTFFHFQTGGGGGAVQAKSQELHSAYGGLSFPPTVMQQLLRTGRRGDVCWVEARRWLQSADEMVADWKVYLPGLHCNPFGPFGDDADDKTAVVVPRSLTRQQLTCPRALYQTLRSMVAHYLYADALDEVDALDVWVDGEDFINPAQGYRATSSLVMMQPFGPVMADGDGAEAIRLQKASDPVRAAIAAKMKKRSTAERAGLYPAFLSVRPRYKHFTLALARPPVGRPRGAPAPTVQVADTEGLTLADFMAKAGTLLQRLRGFSSASRLSFTGRRPVAPTEAEDGSKMLATRKLVNDLKPTYVFAQDMDAGAWEALRIHMVDPFIYLDLVGPDAEPKAKPGPVAAAAAAFGFHDLYALSDPALYKDEDRKGRGKATQTVKRPADTRYRDWQWHGQDPLPAFSALPPTVPRDVARSKTLVMPLHQLVDVDVPDNAAGLADLGAMSRMDRHALLREYSYAHALSIHTGGLSELPIHGPPVESILAIASASLPKVSLGVLTPSETRRLQESHYGLRNLALDRVQRCPWSGCRHTFPAAARAALEAHVAAAHAPPQTCNFCDEPLYGHWGAAARTRHFVRRHRDVLAAWADQPGDEVVPPGRGAANSAREASWAWCARCRRDHTALNARADRAHHDAVCYPGAGPVAPQEDAACCGPCGYDLRLHAAAYQTRHRLFCQAVGRRGGAEPDSFCPWCGSGLADLARPQRVAHLAGCAMRPDGGEGPLDLATGERHREDEKKKKKKKKQQEGGGGVGVEAVRDAGHAFQRQPRPREKDLAAEVAALIAQVASEGEVGDAPPDPHHDPTPSSDTADNAPPRPGRRVRLVEPPAGQAKPTPAPVRSPRKRSAPPAAPPAKKPRLSPSPTPARPGRPRAKPLEVQDHGRRSVGAPVVRTPGGAGGRGLRARPSASPVKMPGSPGIGSVRRSARRYF
ncbi:hypothetical protein P8C59_002809 [Phyllachora maydis]|uniref:Uncharacterized protein n=1 Tax=Phyllachora maydis TaxID=1825666 RepID=A0AAD9HYY2_9PEZI|nr:hypothetical protein P8C59_002809 [Phyllachora maydis]